MKRLSITLFATALAMGGLAGCSRDDTMARDRTVETADKASERAAEAAEEVRERAKDLTEAQDDLVEETSDERRDVQEKAAELDKAAAEARRNQDWFQGTRDDVVREARATLDTMDRRIAELTTTLGQRTDLDIEDRRDAEEALAKMRQARSKAADQLGLIEGANATAWDDLRADARDAFEDLDDAYAKARDAIL